VTATSQATLDKRNAAFWDELCGTTLAQQVGVTDASPESLRRFDDAYLEMYPYLTGYLPSPEGNRLDLLEVGLGYGTVSQLLAERGFRYRGLDLAAGPVEMVRHRLEGIDREGEVVQGSVLDLPFEDGSFDHVVSIGCIHHTGDIPRGISEVTRVLRPGGRATLMLYNRHSWRQLRIGVVLRAGRLVGRRRDEHDTRGRHEQNVAGEIAPMVDYVSRREVRRLLAGYSDLQIRAENFDPVVAPWKRIVLPREWFLGNVARVLGLDLYITATK
jgi:SAM-dependent methyltransferase